MANVSPASVSKVLNNRSGVSTFTRQAVLEAIEKLNYQTNHIARGLRMNRSFSIGVVTEDIEGLFTTTLVRGIEDAVRQEGYNVFLCNSYGDRELERSNIEALLSKQVDGLILMSGYKVGGRGLPAAATSGKPVVYLYQYSDSPTIPAILPDDVQGGRIAAEHLVGLGHRRIGVIGGPLNYEAVNLRLDGYRSVLEANGLSFDPHLVHFGEWDQTAAYTATRQLMQLPQPPTAIFCMSDLQAIGVAYALIEMDLHIPRDVSLVGFDNRFFSGNQLPPLTTVELPLYEMGMQAGKLLYDVIDGQVVEGQHYRVPCRLIERESTAPPRAG